MKAEFKISKEGVKTTLAATGDLIAHSTANFYEHLQQVLNHSTIELSLHEVSSIDVSALQLIRASQRAVKANGQRIQIVQPSNNELNNLLVKTGLLGIIQEK
jgi:anti-anti-sigma factor